MSPRDTLIGLFVIGFLAGACAAPPLDTGDTPARPDDQAERVDEDSPEAGEEMSEAERRELRRKLAERGAKKPEMLERVPADGRDAVRGEVPNDLLDAIVADLAESQEADPAAIELAHAEAVTWNDGSLGCPEPGRVYTQALVPGYRVILEYEGQQFDYRATERGHFIVCSRPTLAAPGAGDEPPVD